MHEPENKNSLHHKSISMTFQKTFLATSFILSITFFALFSTFPAEGMILFICSTEALCESPLDGYITLLGPEIPLITWGCLWMVTWLIFYRLLYKRQLFLQFISAVTITDILLFTLEKNILSYFQSIIM